MHEIANCVLMVFCFLSELQGSQPLQRNGDRLKISFFQTCMKPCKKSGDDLRGYYPSVPAYAFSDEWDMAATIYGYRHKLKKMEVIIYRDISKDKGDHYPASRFLVPYPKGTSYGRFFGSPSTRKPPIQISFLTQSSWCLKRKSEEFLLSKQGITPFPFGKSPSKCGTTGLVAPSRIGQYFFKTLYTGKNFGEFAFITDHKGKTIASISPNNIDAARLSDRYLLLVQCIPWLDEQCWRNSGFLFDLKTQSLVDKKSRSANFWASQALGYHKGHLIKRAAPHFPDAMRQIFLFDFSVVPDKPAKPHKP